MRGLNLGCGRAQFPITDVNNKYSEHNEEFLSTCPEAYDPSVEWINIDRIAQPGVNKIVNLFRYPWLDDKQRGFESNSVDIIWCSHIVEHIPHVMRLNNHSDHYLSELYEHDGDGWWAFFYEAWRILKPKGRLHILAPYGWHSAGITDPTHTRLILPGSFGYFAPSDDAPFDYALPYQFKQKVINPKTEEGQLIMRFVNESYGHILEIQAAKTYLEGSLSDEERARVERELEKFNKDMDAFTRQHINQIEDLYIVLEAVK